MATERSHRKTAKTIRNLRGTLVHMRLHSEDSEKPYRIELQPRGAPGDVATVPAKLTDDGTFIQGVDVLFEIIPLSEAKKLQYTQPYREERLPVEVIRPDQNIVSREAAWDGTGRTPARAPGAGPAVADVPGSDPELSAAVRAGTSALPDGALTPRVTTERVKE
jgi:hypothetical protein